MPNRLANAQSLYLRKHAENPIDWWPWCDEALATAKAENKPIFLSIGYSSCHWCTVMEGEAFSDLAIADYMNANFLAIKVDREERPDLDSIYMQALQMMAGQGGWPLNIFLSPEDLVPFYGGTYFPVEPRYGRPGFLQVLQSIRRFFDMEGEKLQSFKQEMLGTLQQIATLASDTVPNLSKNLLYQGFETSSGIVGANEYGRPRFPMMPYAQSALQGVRFNYTSRYNSQQICQQRGLDLALGGIYDHVGGGFHRYTVDATWTVPHFEKMLYDNGQILEYLANLWSLGWKEPAFHRAIAGTVAWLKREMRSPAGYFYAAQDADNFVYPDAAEPEEGAFYVWEREELQALLAPEDLSALEQHFTVTAEGNFEGKNVLQRRDGLELPDLVEKALNKLFSIRYGGTLDQTNTFPPARNNQEVRTLPWPGRIPPVTDTKMIVAWNSLAISGLSRAYAVFADPDYWELATDCAQFIIDRQWVDGCFYRLNYDGQVANPAQSEDYAFFIKALLDLQSVVPQETQWLETAIALQREFDERLWSVELGAYYNNSDRSGDLIVRERNYIDNATPSANGIAIANLVRLALLSENLDYFSRAEQALQAFAKVMEDSPQTCPSLFVALDWYYHASSLRSSPDILQFLAKQFLPTTVYQVAAELPSNAVGLVCQGFTCLEPAQSVEEIINQIQQVTV